ncbi:hypothetical protein OH492_22800 [Vibrio chagasii]|nr:hypothetical protein [Vibrio chagasii]
MKNQLNMFTKCAWNWVRRAIRTNKPETANVIRREMVVQSLIEEGVEQILGYLCGSVLDI